MHTQVLGVFKQQVGQRKVVQPRVVLRAYGLIPRHAALSNKGCRDSNAPDCVFDYTTTITLSLDHK